MSKIIDLDAIIKKIVDFDEDIHIGKYELKECMKEAIKQTVTYTIGQVKDNVEVDYNNDGLGSDIETYVINGSLDNIEKQVIKELTE